MMQNPKDEGNSTTHHVSALCLHSGGKEKHGGETILFTVICNSIIKGASILW